MITKVEIMESEMRGKCMERFGLTHLISHRLEEIMSRSWIRQNHQLAKRRRIMKSCDGTTKSYQSRLKNNQSAQKLSKITSSSLVEERAAQVLTCLHQFGMAVVDNFLGEASALRIRSQCGNATLTSGLTVDPTSSSSRQDRITWVHGDEDQYTGVGSLLASLDQLITKVKQGLTEYNIEGRTQAMVACYPGNEARYERHVDNPRGDGRVLTCIYYLNPDWDAQQDGGVLKVYPTPSCGGDSKQRVARIVPVLDRLVVFWSDSRTPHEVLPAHRHRYAVTTWYFDKEQREQALNQMAPSTSNKVHPNRPNLDPNQRNPNQANPDQSDSNYPVPPVNVTPKADLRKPVQKETTPRINIPRKHDEERITPQVTSGWCSSCGEDDADDEMIDVVEWDSDSECEVSFNEKAAPKVDLAHVAEYTFKQQKSI